MKNFFILAVILMTSCYSFSQTSFYILSGGNITKVENSDPSRLNIIEWRILLYNRGATKSGTSYWGTIKGSTSEQVMEKLKKEQKFELDFNMFIGKGKVEDAIYTHFNPLGPIAVIDDRKASQLSLTDSQTNITDIYIKAVDLFYTGLDVKNNLDVILKGNENLYSDIGGNFMQYSEGIKDAVLQIRVVQNLLNKSTGATLENINKQIKEIGYKLDDAETKQKKINTFIHSINPMQTGKVDNNFYIFLTTTLELKPKESQFSNLQSSKTLYIISKPLLHGGELTDDMQSEKRQFLTDIQNHFADKSEILKELSGKKMGVHFTKPYSTQLLRKKEEGYEAIDGYKTSIKEALEGLAQFDFLIL